MNKTRRLVFLIIISVITLTVLFGLWVFKPQSEFNMVPEQPRNQTLLEVIAEKELEEKKQELEAKEIKEKELMESILKDEEFLAAVERSLLDTLASSDMLNSLTEENVNTLIERKLVPVFEKIEENKKATATIAELSTAVNMEEVQAILLTALEQTREYTDKEILEYLAKGEEFIASKIDEAFLLYQDYIKEEVNNALINGETIIDEKIDEALLLVEEHMKSEDDKVLAESVNYVDDAIDALTLYVDDMDKKEALKSTSYTDDGLDVLSKKLDEVSAKHDDFITKSEAQEQILSILEDNKEAVFNTITDEYLANYDGLTYSPDQEYIVSPVRNTEPKQTYSIYEYEKIREEKRNQSLDAVLDLLSNP